MASIITVAIRRSWLAAVLAVSAALIAPSLVDALIAMAFVFAVVFSITFCLTKFEAEEKREWQHSGSQDLGKGHQTDQQ